MFVFADVEGDKSGNNFISFHRDNVGGTTTRLSDKEGLLYLIKNCRFKLEGLELIPVMKKQVSVACALRISATARSFKRIEDPFIGETKQGKIFLGFSVPFSL